MHKSLHEESIHSTMFRHDVDMEKLKVMRACFIFRSSPPFAIPFPLFYERLMKANIQRKVQDYAILIPEHNISVHLHVPPVTEPVAVPVVAPHIVAALEHPVVVFEKATQRVVVDGDTEDVEIGVVVHSGYASNVVIEEQGKGVQWVGPFDMDMSDSTARRRYPPKDLDFQGSVHNKFYHIQGLIHDRWPYLDERGALQSPQTSPVHKSLFGFGDAYALCVDNPCEVEDEEGKPRLNRTKNSVKNYPLLPQTIISHYALMRIGIQADAFMGMDDAKGSPQIYAYAWDAKPTAKRLLEHLKDTACDHLMETQSMVGVNAAPYAKTPREEEFWSFLEDNKTAMVLPVVLSVQLTTLSALVRWGFAGAGIAFGSIIDAVNWFLTLEQGTRGWAKIMGATAGTTHIATRMFWAKSFVKGLLLGIGDMLKWASSPFEWAGRPVRWVVEEWRRRKQRTMKEIQSIMSSEARTEREETKKRNVAELRRRAGPRKSRLQSIAQVKTFLSAKNVNVLRVSPFVGRFDCETKNLLVVRHGKRYRRKEATLRLRIDTGSWFFVGEDGSEARIVRFVPGLGGAVRVVDRRKLVPKTAYNVRSFLAKMGFVNYRVREVKGVGFEAMYGELKVSFRGREVRVLSEVKILYDGLSADFFLVEGEENRKIVRFDKKNKQIVVL